LRSADFKDGNDKTSTSKIINTYYWYLFMAMKITIIFVPRLNLIVGAGNSWVD
jgi:hypothetical protein